MNKYWQENKPLNKAYIDSQLEIISNTNKALKNLKTFSAFQAVCKHGIKTALKFELV